jgi:RimJ/RimL family protein N-acetyltransferase
MTKPILLDIPMPITTQRLLLRNPMPGDGAELNAAIHETFDELKEWMPWAQTLPSVEESEENIRHAYAKWILREDLRISIFDKVTGAFAGSTGLHQINWEVPTFEIGYWLRKSFLRKGIATESTNALARFAFKEFKAKRVVLKCNSKNQKSISVIERLGFEFEGCLRNDEIGLTEGQLGTRDTLVYSLLTPDRLPELNVSW